MSEKIPPDVMEAAEAVFDATSALYYGDAGVDCDVDAITAIIARALMAATAAERERCAKIADEHSDETAQVIATAIRASSRGEE